MPFEKIAPPGALSPGEMIEVQNGERTYVVCNVDGQLHALDGLCPHQSGPLAHGALHGNMIVCPWHAWEFDSITGCHDFNPQLCLQKYPVESREDGIYLDTP